MERMTASKPLRRVMIWNWKGSRVSRLRFTPVRPASAMASSFLCNAMPLVVRQSSRSPLGLREPICCINGTISFRIVGSPPVSRILVTP